MTKFTFVLARLVPILLLSVAQMYAENVIEVKVYPTILNPVSPYLYGQFMERASWSGETGAELVIGDDGRLRDDVVSEIRQFAPPVIRFPGGTFLSMSESYEWTHLIDHAPYREDAARPESYKDHQGNATTTRFGWDEWMELREQVPFEPVVVVEIEDALLRRESIKTAPWENAAAMVAYFNGSLGHAYPRDMEQYVRARVKNGHPEPYGVKYFQLGNEWFVFWDKNYGDGDDDNDLSGEWVAEVTIAYIDAMKRVDPSIKIIVDGDLRGDESGFFEHPGISERIDLVAFHTYWPMGPYNRVFTNRDDPGVDAVDFPAEELWNDWVSCLGEFNEEGELSVIREKWWEPVERGYQLAFTEWNWNGWKDDNYEELTPEQNPWPAMGIGAAGYLHGMVRQGEYIALATQSMFVGNGWNIPAIRIPSNGQKPFLSPQGQMTAFYNQYSGNWRMKLELKGIPILNKPSFSTGRWTLGEQKIQAVDIVATGDEAYVNLHVINRSFSEDYELSVDLSAIDSNANVVEVLTLSVRDPNADLTESKPVFEEHQQVVSIEDIRCVNLGVCSKTVTLLRIKR